MPNPALKITDILDKQKKIIEEQQKASAEIEAAREATRQAETAQSNQTVEQSPNK